MKFWRYIANKKSTFSNNNDSLEEQKQDTTDLSSSLDSSKEDEQNLQEQNDSQQSGESRESSSNQDTLEDQETKEHVSEKDQESLEESSSSEDDSSKEQNSSEEQNAGEMETSKNKESSQSSSEDDLNQEQKTSQENSSSQNEPNENGENTSKQSFSEQGSSDEQENVQEQSSSEKESQEQNPSEQESSSHQDSEDNQDLEGQDANQGDYIDQSLSSKMPFGGAGAFQASSEDQNSSGSQGIEKQESSKDPSTLEGQGSNNQELSRPLDTSQEPKLSESSSNQESKSSREQSSSEKEANENKDASPSQERNETSATQDQESSIDQGISQEQKESKNKESNGQERDINEGTTLKDQDTKEEKNHKQDNDEASDLDPSSIPQEEKQDNKPKKSEKEKSHKRKKDPFKDGDAEVPKEKIEKPERTEATNQFLGQLGTLPFFKDRSHGGSYSIDTSSDTEVSETVIRTLISKFLNQRFCRKVSDLNVRSTALERSEGFYRWDVKRVVKHLETEQLTKVLHDKYGYQYAQGKYENVPLSFYFDMSGSMSNYTNMLSVMAIELLKKDVKVLVGFNETVHVQIESIPKELTVKELAKFLSSAGYSSSIENCPKETKDRITYRAINQDIDKYLISKKAEKCVIFADCDPIREIIRLSQKVQVYWFNFESYFRSYDLGGYKGFAYKVSSLEDIAEGLIKVNEKRFEALVYTDTDSDKTLRR